jgi:hypothetical protein
MLSHSMRLKPIKVTPTLQRISVIAFHLEHKSFHLEFAFNPLKISPLT